MGLVGQRLELQQLTADAYSRKRVDRRWMCVVEDVSPSAHSKMKECRKRVSMWECENGHRFRRGSLCNQRNLCPVDAYAFTRDQADSGLEDLEQIAARMGGKVRVWAGEFTLPKKAQRLVGSGDGATMRSLAAKTLNDLFSEDGRYMLGFQCSFHMWHSSDPFSGWFPHVHVNVNEVVYDKVDGVFVKRSLWLKDIFRS